MWAKRQCRLKLCNGMQCICSWEALPVLLKKCFQCHTQCWVKPCMSLSCVSNPAMAEMQMHEWMSERVSEKDLLQGVCGLPQPGQ